MKILLQSLLLVTLLVVLTYLAWPNLLVPQGPKIVFPKESIEIPVNPMFELDFKTRKEFTEIRRAAVMKHKRFFPNSYAPSEKVFGGIEDKKSWWGIEGIYYYGPGAKSIEGPSEETRFIGNPLLLVGVCEGFAFLVEKTGERKDVESYPKLESISWEGKSRMFHIKYNLWDYLRFIRRIRASFGRRLNFIAYNARDFGLNWLYVYPDKSANLELHQLPEKASRIRQFLHRGGSSGYKGGSNNASPRQKFLEFTPQRLPAKAMIGLWKEEPKSVNDPPDVRVLIEMK